MRSKTGNLIRQSVHDDQPDDQASRDETSDDPAQPATAR